MAGDEFNEMELKKLREEYERAFGVQGHKIFDLTRAELITALMSGQANPLAPQRSRKNKGGKARYWSSSANTFVSVPEDK